MFGSVVIDVAIGMAFVYLLMSLIASVIQEILATFLQLRPANLERGIRSLFSGDSIWGQDMVDAIYNHGLVRGLYADPNRDLEQSVQSAQRAFEAAQAGLEAATSAARTSGLTADGTHGLIDVARKTADKAKAEFEALKKATQRGWWTKTLDFVRRLLQTVVGIKAEKNISGVTSQVLLPAYIPSRTFALALIDILNTSKAPGQYGMNAITKSLADHHWIYRTNKAGEALLALAVDAKGDLASFQTNVENWYNDSMDRVSGWYKKNIQRILIFIGLILAVVFNVSSIRVAQTLWFDRDSRQAMVNAADEYAKSHQPKAGDANTPAAGSGQASAAELQTKLEDSANAFKAATNSALLPVGWKLRPLDYLRAAWNYLRSYHGKDTPGWFWSGFRDRLWRSLEVLVGWVITAMAISLGAPFWFDTLNKFMVVRSTIKPQEKSQTEGSKD